MNSLNPVLVSIFEFKLLSLDFWSIQLSTSNFKFSFSPLKTSSFPVTVSKNLISWVFYHIITPQFGGYLWLQTFLVAAFIFLYFLLCKQTFYFIPQIVHFLLCADDLQSFIYAFAAWQVPGILFDLMYASDVIWGNF